MKQQIKLSLEQINFTVGDIDENYKKIVAAYKKSQDVVDLLVFCELSLTGYPPLDLLQKSYFIKEIELAIEKLCTLTKEKKAAILVSAPVMFSDRNGNKSLYNSMLLIEEGGVKTIANKSNLPNYGVFDEKRYFSAATNLTCVNFKGFEIALMVCEDIWDKKNAFLLADKNLDAIISVHASPFEIGKNERRIVACKAFVDYIKKPLIYVNQIGGQDSLVFDGSSFVMDGEGEVVFCMKEFEEDSALVDLGVDDQGLIFVQKSNESPVNENLCKDHKIYNACILGLRDYIIKNGFKNVIIGMSGGIDSALVATIAVDALGSDNVKLVALPTKYNSEESLKDAKECADNLGLKLELISIEAVFEEMLATLSDQFKDTKQGVAEENIQSRIRGNILMALSNKFGNLLLSTGNKSELAVGYATIYGDMCGAFNPIKDIYKTEVFELAKWRNKNIPSISIDKKHDIIPANIIKKEPSAELRENQKDSDSLPPYEILDSILYQLIEEEKSIEQVVDDGHDHQIVKKIANLFYSSEYKRKQSVIGPKVSKMSFDLERRYPITNNFSK